MQILLSYWATREGKPFSTPNASISGPKVMIINEYAGSGGDALPLYFRRRGLGQLVGKRTWGGLVGIYDGLWSKFMSPRSYQCVDFSFPWKKNLKRET